MAFGCSERDDSPHAVVDEEIDRITRTNAAALREELAEDAAEASATVEKALAELAAAREEWRINYVRMGDLLGVIDPQAMRERRLPDLPPEIDKAGAFASTSPSVPIAVV